MNHKLAKKVPYYHYYYCFFLKCVHFVMFIVKMLFLNDLMLHIVCHVSECYLINLGK